MGKVYDAERRDESASQLALAKQLDPLDPTPWLYDALRLLDENRPIAGLLSLHEAAERNADRAVFRSRLLMDQDIALRTSGGLGRLHREAGLVQSGFVHAWDSIAADPTNSAAHQLLSDIYSVVPRYEIARVSELHIAQLTQPANLTPIQPQLGQPMLSIANSVGPSDLAVSELGPMVAENGPRFRGSLAPRATTRRAETSRSQASTIASRTASATTSFRPQASATTTT